MNDTMKELTIGCIGQGYVGKNYADNFEERGFKVVRYALEEPFVGNKEKIPGCDIVFIGVPTPTTPDGFDISIVERALELVGKGNIAVIKSSIIPGCTQKLQQKYPDISVLFSPEFLSEATAAQDVNTPFASIVGMPDPETQKEKAQLVLDVLPSAPFSRICPSIQAELFKYAHNTSGYIQVVFFNMLYDLTMSFGEPWDLISEAIVADPYISNRYGNPVHKSGRGAGGHCFIKDFAALRELYAKQCPGDAIGLAVMTSLESKNKELLRASGKDIDLLEGVYGTESK